jgi:hypothetical protein
MRFFSSLVDWLVQRLFWLSIVAMTSTAQADVLLWTQAPCSVDGGMLSAAFNQIQPGQIRSQAIDLTQAARLEQLSLNLGQGFMSPGSGVNIALWLDSTPGQRQTLIYSGVIRSAWSGLSVYLPTGRSWLSVENTSLTQSIIWAGPVGGTGGALTTSSGTTATSSYGGSARGTYVPEPSVVPALIVAAIVGAGIFWRRVFGYTH